MFLTQAGTSPNRQPARASPGWPADVALVGLLALCAMLLGTSYVRAVRHSGSGPQMTGFSQQVFGAAMMSACGRGLTTPAPGDFPLSEHQRMVAEFLSVQRETLSCADIPADLHVWGLDGMQRASRYLLLLPAATWRLTGPSWAAIDRLLGILFAISAALAFLLCRVTIGRLVAAGVTLLFVLSPLHLANLTDLRDYSKAPFFLASLSIAGLLVTRARPSVTVVRLSAAAGAIIGFGFGVRTDVVLNLGLVAVAVLALPHSAASQWRVRAAAAAAALAAFVVVASPILMSRESDANLWHWALLGYARDFDDALGVAPAAYETGYFYDDSYVASTIDAYFGRTTGESTKVSVGLPHYAEASRRYYGLVLRTFPADALLRAWAAVIKILDLSYSRIAAPQPALLAQPVERALLLRDRLLAMPRGAGVALFALTTLAVSARNVPMATALFAIVAFLCSYPAIQFQPRHFFHLELVSLWFLGFACSEVAALVAAGRRGLLPERWHDRSSRSLGRAVSFAAAALVVIAAPLTALRVYQQRSATALLEAYERASIVPGPLVPAPAGGGVVRIAGASDLLPRERPERSMLSDLLVAEIGSRGCHTARTALTFRYATKVPGVDFSRTLDVPVPATDQLTRVFFPVYQTGATSPGPHFLAFDGVDVPAADVACVKRIGRVADADAFRLLLPAVLPAGWRRLPLHQTLRGSENSTRVGG